MCKMKLSRRRALASCSSRSPRSTGCASSSDDEVKKIRAQALFEQGLKKPERQAGVAGPDLAEGGRPARPRELDLSKRPRCRVPRPSQASGSPGGIQEGARARARLRGGRAQPRAGLSPSRGDTSRPSPPTGRRCPCPSIPRRRSPTTTSGGPTPSSGRPTEAEEALRTAIQLEPKLGAAYYELGVIMTRTGRKEDAKAAFRTRPGPGSRLAVRPGGRGGPENPGGRRLIGASPFPLTAPAVLG